MSADTLYQQLRGHLHYLKLAAIAEQLARATISGAGALIAADARPASELRKEVTSPGGTTEAALKVLMSPDGLDALMQRAVEAATRRGRDLGKA